MGPSVGRNSLLIRLFGFNCAQMTPGRAESDFGLQGWIGTSGLKQNFSFSMNVKWRNSQTFFTRVSTISNKFVLLDNRKKISLVCSRVFLITGVCVGQSPDFCLVSFVLCKILQLILLVIIFVPHRNSSRFTNQSKKQSDTDTSRRT